MIDEDELTWALKHLERVSRRLKAVALMLLTLTLVNTAIIFSVSGGFIYINLSSVFGLSSAVTFMVFFLSLCFDSMKKDGRAYYDEITCALHQVSKIDNVGAFRQDSIVVKVAIRQFINSVDIPLIPGNLGPGLLVLLNIMVTISLILFKATSF